MLSSAKHYLGLLWNILGSLWGSPGVSWSLLGLSGPAPEVAVATDAAEGAAVGAAVEAAGAILEGLGVALGLLLQRSSHERASRSLAETGLCFCVFLATLNTELPR